ncbi:MAG: FAD-dependent oxidoreductase [Spirochaetales bacterium]|nr:FAD-dependent oxidoreductase [Spirochaetales bacterium]
MMTNGGRKLIQVHINGKECAVFEGVTILQAAREQGLHIPTLCDDRRLEPYGSCWVCLVKVEGAKGFVPSCATQVRPGMKIVTDDEEVRQARKLAFELILSNHYGDCKAPCTLACPSNIDVQGYVGLIAYGKNAEALKLVKKNNPFPSVCGRVCPRPCEDECRRNIVDEPVGIDYLKRYIADIDLFSGNPWKPEVAPSNGKKVAVIGGGPAGLSAAYYLKQAGTEVTVYEAQEKAGGMLRYGIPDYRLPQDVLDKEIALITDLGVSLICGKCLGTELELETLLKENDAVLLALGAWQSREMRIAGEDLPGVLPGIDMLRGVAEGNHPKIGRKVAVIGGGNTAIDAARTSLRLGADDVQIFYRRSREEMPASDMEIEEALEEGIRITYLAAPSKITKGRNNPLELHLITMELGEPDPSGRRRPVPVEGADFSWEVDTVIAAVGQYTDTSSLKTAEGLVDERGNIVCDKETGATAIPKLFAAGDVVTGPDIAIRAIAGGKHAAASIGMFFAGLQVERKAEFLVRKSDLRPVTAEDLEDEEKLPRQTMPKIPLERRRRSFSEIEMGYTDEQALIEARRCLECGCQDVHECKLKEYAQEYEARIDRFVGDFQVHPVDKSHPYIVRDPSKCILCGRCVRICQEVQGLGVLGYVKRGFASHIEPSFGSPFGEVDLCISCGQCVSACPVGALTEKFPSGKTVPLEEEVTPGYCPMCSVSCPVEYRSHGSLFTRITERFDTYGGILCERGRFQNTFILQNQSNGKGICSTPDGNLERKKASGLMDSYMKESKKVLMRISPFLSGEVIDYFLARAGELGCVVRPIGLEHINPSWIELNNLGKGGLPESSLSTKNGRRPFNLETHYFFEDTGIDPQRRAALVLGTLYDSNNVAFTEAYRMKKAGYFTLWVVGDNGPAVQRTADRVFPNLSSLDDALQYAQFERRMVDILINPEDLHVCCERDTENRLIQSIGEASTWQKIRVTLFWNARNSWYLLKSLGERESPEEIGNSGGMEDFDLILDVGGNLESNDNRRVIRWGGDNTHVDLHIPVPLKYWIEGYSEPSGRSPLRQGAQDREEIRNALLL